MASAPRDSGGAPSAAPEPAGGDGVWHSTCGYADCAEPGRYAANSTCQGCRRVKYCTRACQKADWKRHKAACKAAEAADEAAAREGALVARPPRSSPPLLEVFGHSSSTAGLNLFAALAGDVEMLKSLGEDVNRTWGTGTPTPLYMASQNGRTAAVSFLLSAPGVAVNAAPENGWTPLFVASRNGHTDVVRALLAARGVSVNASATTGATPLHAAAEHGHAAGVAALLAAPGVAVNAATDDGSTPLHAASFSGHAAIVSALLAHPAVDVNRRTTGIVEGIPAGATPLHVARAKGHLGVAALLEARGGVV